MSNFYYRLEKIIINIIIIGIILSLTTQFVLQNDKTLHYLQNIQQAFKNIINDNDNAVSVSTRPEQEKGIIVFNTVNEETFPNIWILKNGQRVANFKKTPVIVEVNNGDLLTIDGRNYAKVIWYEVSIVSSNINFPQQGQQYRTNNNTVSVGIIELNGGKKL